MNNQQTQPSGVFSTRTQINFPYLTEESLVSLIDTLGFKMGLTELRFCQNYFKSTGTESPTIHELKIIDRVFYDNAQSPSSRVVASFSTNDQKVADAYADLMERRRAVSPHYSEPCSLPEMLNILPAFYKDREKLELSGISLTGGKYRELEAAASACRKIAESGDCSAVISVRKNPQKSKTVVGDTLYAVLKSFNRYDDFEARLVELLNSSEMLASSKETFILKDRGIFTALSQLNFGVKLNTSAFEGKDGCVSPFEHFAEVDFGSISIFDKSKAADMLITAQNLGLRVVELGHLDKGNFISSTAKSGETLSVNQNLLRSVAFSTVMTAEADGEAPDISEESESLYITIGEKRRRMNSAVCGGESYFMAGFNTVVHAYSLCAVSGATEMIGAGVYTLPLENPTPKDLGKSLELILGAYKAQCELGLYDVCPQIIFGEKPSLQFHTLSDATLNPPTKTALAGSRIRYAEPPKTSDGVPDIKAMKGLYACMNGLTREGKISAITPATSDIKASLDKIIASPNAVHNITDDFKSQYGGVLFATVDSGLAMGGEVASIPCVFSDKDDTEKIQGTQQFQTTT